VFFAVVYACFSSGELGSFLPKAVICFLRALISGVHQGFERGLLLVRGILAFAAFDIASSCPSGKVGKTSAG
jgi:hypothetical protein